MEDKRTLIAALLCFIVVWFYTETVLNPKYRQNAPTSASTQQAGQNQQVVGTSPVNGTSVSSPNTNISAPSSAVSQNGSANTAISGSGTAILTLERINKGPKILIHTSKVDLELALVGGRLAAYKLLDYKAHLNAEEPLDLVKFGEKPLLPLGVYSGAVSDAAVEYKLESAADANEQIDIPVGGERTLTLVGNFADGRIIRKSFHFGPSPYLFNVAVQLSAPAADGSKAWLEWSHFLSPEEVNSKLDPFGYVLLDENKKLSHVALHDMQGGVVDHGSSAWIGLADKYFMGTLIPADGKLANVRLGRDEQTFVSRIVGNESGVNASIFAGPKEPTILTQAGFNLERSIDLGWFSPVAYPLLAMIRFFYLIFNNYGLAIITLTLLIKAMFLPLTKASLQSMKKMQELQPEMQALRERIKDATELNKAVLELYKKRGVNPMGGCLPMLIQLPVFLGLYNTLLNAIELRHAPFALWIKDLSAPEALHIGTVNVPVMLLLMAASMYIQQLTSPQVGDPAQQKVMRMMPIVFVVMFVFFIPMPAGLVLYWLVNNSISIIQQMHLRSERRAGPYSATAFASIAIFGVGYLVTLL